MDVSRPILAVAICALLAACDAVVPRLSAIYSWTLSITGNARDGRAPTTTDTSGGLECPFGIMARLAE